MTSPNDRCFYPMQESDRLAACNEFRSRHSNERGLVSYGDLWVDHPFTEDPSNAIATFAKRVRDWYDSPLEDPFPLDALEELERQAPSNTQLLEALVVLRETSIGLRSKAWDLLLVLAKVKDLPTEVGEAVQEMAQPMRKLQELDEAPMRDGEGE